MAGVTPTGGRGFLQQRLALFGRWFFIVAFAYYLIANLPLDAVMGYPFDWVTEWFGPEERITLAIIGCAAVVWLAAAGRPLPARLLAALDALSVVGPLVLMSLAIVSRGELNDVFTVLLGCTNVVVVRAIVVPSTARRTLVLGALGFAPIVAATVAAMARDAALAPRTATQVAISAALWATVAVACSAVSSRILFRLRVEVAAIRALGQYHLIGEIGHGAMGIVYRADHTLLRRPTAIKLLAPGRNSEDDLRRFEREVQLTARLTHPNTVAVFDYGRSDDGIFYYAMEFIDGLSLEQLVARSGPQPAWRVIHLLRQACGALDEAHRVGLIHRDIKPANLMICRRGGIPDVVKVLDFGLVKPLDPGAAAAASITDDVVGTPLYMSPEAVQAPGSVDQRSDLYALGAVGYFLITGTPVFSGATVVAICSKHLADAPEPPSRRLGAPVPADLEALILRCLAKKPADRPASAAELADLLAGCADAAAWNPARVEAFWSALPPPAPETRLTGKLTIELRR